MDFSELSEQDLAMTISLLAAYQKRAKTLLDKARTVWTDTHEPGAHTPLHVYGVNMGELTVTREGEGKPIVTDETVYAQWLAAHGYETMTQLVLRPQSAAMTPEFIRALTETETVDSETGEIVKPVGSQPDGTGWRHGVTSQAKIVNTPTGAMDQLIDGTPVTSLARLLAIPNQSQPVEAGPGKDPYMLMGV